LFCAEYGTHDAPAQQPPLQVPELHVHVFDTQLAPAPQSWQLAPPVPHVVLLDVWQ
jgi:hypothetical protein